MAPLYYPNPMRIGMVRRLSPVPQSTATVGISEINTSFFAGKWIDLLARQYEM